MPTYYNLSTLADKDGYIGILQGVSQLTQYMLGYSLIVLTFLIPTIYMMNKGSDPLRSVHLSSLYSGLLSIFFYVGQIIPESSPIYICALIYLVTASIRWYTND